jgi:hypothetical protein
LATSLVPSTFGALHTLIANAISPVRAYYGPVATDDPLKKAVGIGWDGNPDGDFNSLSDWSQSWAGLGAFRRDEEFSINCYAISWNGDHSASELRLTEVFEILGDIEDALRANPGLGLTQPFVAEFANGDLFLDGGTAARLTFRIRIAIGRI